MSNRWKNVLFGIYSYFSTISSLVLNLMPPFVRTIIYKIFLGGHGAGTFVDYGTYIRYFKNLYLGENVAINKGCEFYTSHHLAKKILIGNNVTISPNVKFYGARQDYLCPDMSDIAEDIIIEDDCYICADSIVLQGVRIGKGSVIGAGSIVTKDIPEYSVAVGAPCKVIKSVLEEKRKRDENYHL